MTSTATSPESRHLWVVPTKDASKPGTLTRAQVTARLGVNVSTLRRCEGDRLHPRVDEDDVRWSDDKEVAALAASLANELRVILRRNAEPSSGIHPASRSPGEIAAESSSVSNSASRFGPGACRVTASALEPARLRWAYVVGRVGR
jgi:hypothetical protein